MSDVCVIWCAQKKGQTKGTRGGSLSYGRQANALRSARSRPVVAEGRLKNQAPAGQQPCAHRPATGAHWPEIGHHCQSLEHTSKSARGKRYVASGQHHHLLLGVQNHNAPEFSPEALPFADLNEIMLEAGQVKLPSMLTEG